MNPSSGGPCQGIRNSIPELEKLGAYNEVVCLDDPAAPFLKQDPIAIHALGAAKSSWCYSPKLIPWLLKNLTRFDIVIVHGLWLYNGYAIKEALRILQRKQFASNGGIIKLPKLYIMPHGMLDPYFQRASGRMLKALRNWFYWKLIESKIINEATGLLFTCEVELQLAKMAFRPYRPQRAINIGYGIISPPNLKPEIRQAFLEQCPELNNNSYFLFLSRIHEKKGVDFLIQAYLEVVRNIENVNEEITIAKKRKKEPKWNISKKDELPKLVIAGPGIDTSYGKKVQKMVIEHPALCKLVFFPGMLSGNAKWGALHGCEAFILPSHQENFGIAVVEALACGKPVLISNQVNIWKEIENATCGIVDDDTVSGTNILLETWLKLSRDKRNLMGQNARKLYEEKFSAEAAAQQLFTVIKN